MIKLSQLLSEVVRLNSIKEINDVVLNDIVAAAQKIYDEWKQDENGHDDWLGSGGICHLIAEEIVNVLSGHNIWRCHTVSSTHEQHVYVVGQFREGIYMIDIPYSVYEEGGGFTWKKLPDVTFERNDVTIYRLDSNPRSLKQYMDEF